MVIYKSCVATLFDYASFFYGAASDSNLLKLQRLQNRGLRTCLDSVNVRYSVLELHALSSVAMLDRRRDELMLGLMFKLYGKEVGRRNEIVNVGNDRQTRADSHLLFSLRRPITEGYRKSPRYRGNMLWNVQPEWLKRCETKIQFKRCMKRVVDLRAKYPVS